MLIAERSRTRRSGLLKSGLIVCLLSTPWLTWQAAAPVDATVASQESREMVLQRGKYVKARVALGQGDRTEYQRLRDLLTDYSLLPYLEYAELEPRLAELPRAEVEHFLNSYRDSYLGQRLERQWVLELAEQERWDDVLRYHDPANSFTTQSCHALRARLETGDMAALDEVAALWNVSRSQPNECDPVFEQWMAHERLTPELAWDRFGKTLRAGRRHLARYVSSLMPPREQALAELYLLVDNQPELLKDHDALDAPNTETGEIILHGVRRLARIDAPQAMMQLHRHDSRHHFDDREMLGLQRFIAMRLLLQGFVSETETLLKNTPELATEPLVSWLLRDALSRQDWDRVETWLAQLPAEAQASDRWTYWRARLLEREGTEATIAEARALYTQLSAARSFYGFLSADLLERDYELADRPVPVNGTHMRALYDNPAIERAYELYQLGDEVNAGNEWNHATRSMSEEQIVSSGNLADSWGWHRNSIQAMIRVGYWDDLHLRFPLAYREQFAAAAEAFSLQPRLLFAVTRQESAFMHDARSAAGARGLMQLMPGTARQTANGAGMSIVDAEDLYNPDINIMLGSRYMAELLEAFDGNRAVAAAAYNAGPNRVRQWLRRNGENPLPLDIWIETIPFAETRGYVQNVLAYSVIYGYRMGDMVAFLSEEEAASML